MSKSKRTDKTNRGNLSQYGLFDVSANLNFDGGLGGSLDDDDDDLEAELAALTGGTGAKPKRPKKAVPTAQLDSMVAESLKDIPSDEEELSDEDDPGLLSELQEIMGEEEVVEPQESTPTSPATPPQSTDIVKLLNDRLKMYEAAEKNAKEAGESSRARRFNRGLKTIKDLIRQANAGNPINNDDIPPEVSTGTRKPVSNDDAPQPQPQPSRPAPSIPTSPVDSSPPPEPQPESPKSPSSPQSSVNQELVTMLTERKNQYKIAALKAKKNNDKETALRFIKIAKQFENVIAAAESGQPVDLSLMPGPPEDSRPQPKIEENRMQTNSNSDGNASAAAAAAPAPVDGLIMASSVEEALNQRLEVYKKQEESAKEQNNASKARRMGRIVKQYEQAIKLHKAGKPIPVDELPTPPGYGPIPVPGGAAPQPPAQKPNDVPTAPPRAKPTPAPSTSQTTRLTGNQQPNSRAEKQLILLLAKQKEFKEAALNAKRKGEIEQAKEYLRTAKGFDKLIQASTCGLPVDLSTLPVSPAAKSQLNDYEIILSADADNNGDTANLDVISRLEAQLTKQLKMCLSTRDHHKALGDVAGTNRFERLALNVTKDLDVVRLAHRTPGAGVPKFHYEMKDFSIVKSFTEIGENELELSILRGISYSCSNPKDIDTYVKFEFPYPQDVPYRDKTVVVKDTNNPEYNATFTIPIQRTQRACQRIFKRQGVKFEVYSRGGFFRSDTLLGTANVKLQQLETQCELHESFDLMEGRKKAGGKLEVRLRLRHPILTEQVEQLHEKWLVIDS